MQCFGQIDNHCGKKYQSTHETISQLSKGSRKGIRCVCADILKYFGDLIKEAGTLFGVDSLGTFRIGDNNDLGLRTLHTFEHLPKFPAPREASRLKID
jgi:hypothetical protein